MTVSAQDAHEYPLYNARFRLIVPLLDADGDPISPSSPDTELSQDMGTFADATNEATEIATSSGIIYVDLIATELDTKSTVVRVQSTGAKTTVAVLTPRRLPVHRAGTAQAGAASTITLDTGASAIDDYYNGMWVNITNDTPSGVRGQARKIVDYVGSTKVATIEGTWGTNPSSSSTFEVLIPSDSQYRQADLIAVAGIANNTALAQVGVNVVTNADKTGYSLTTPQSFNLIGNVSGTLSNVNNVVNPVTVGTNSDKTGYSLSSPQAYNLIGNVSGTLSNVLNVVNPVTAGNVTGSVFGNVNGSVGSVTQPVGISTGTFIDALVDRVWDEDVDSSHQTAGTAGKKLDDAGSAGDPWGTALNAYAAGTAGNILYTRMPTGAVTVSDKTGFSLSTPQIFNLIGNVSGTVSNVVTTANVTNPVTVGTNNDKTGYSLSSPQNFNLVGNISGTVSNVTTTLNVTNPVTAGNVTGSVFGNVNGSVNSVTQPVGISTGTFFDALVDKVWDEDVDSSHQTAGSAGKKLDDAGSAGDPWGTSLAGYSIGTAGHTLHTRMPTGAVTVSDKTGFSLSSPQTFDLNGTVSNVTTVATVTNPVGISTGSFLLALADVVWDEDVESTHQTAGSAGKKLDDAGSAGDPWNTALPGSYVAGSAGHILASRMPTGTVLVGDKTGFSLSSPQNFNLVGNITGTITNVLNVVNPVVVTGSVVSVTNPVTVGTNNDKTGYGLATGTLLDAIADKVWDEQIVGHLTAGSTGDRLDDAGSAGDPWSTNLPGVYASGTAGYIVGQHVDAKISSRQPSGTVTVGTNQDKLGYSLSSPQTWNLIGNISGTVTTVTNLTNAGTVIIGDSDITTIANRVWSSQYSPIRTLTTVAGDAMPPLVGDDVWAVRGDTFVWDITGLDLAHLSKIQFSVKGKYYNDDTESLIFAESSTGLLYIDGVPGTASNAAITYSQASGTAQIRVEAVEMAKLDVQQAYYDVQIIRTTGTFVSSPLLGNFHVVGDTTRATS